jgi:hypothetical protein
MMDYEKADKDAKKEILFVNKYNISNLIDKNNDNS